MINIIQKYSLLSLLFSLFLSTYTDIYQIEIHIKKVSMEDNIE